MSTIDPIALPIDATARANGTQATESQRTLGRVQPVAFPYGVIEGLAA